MCELYLSYWLRFACFLSTRQMNQGRPRVGGLTRSPRRRPV